MSDDFSMTISIPADDDGYVLLQCPNCGTYFKATPSDVQDDGVLELFCPSCGLAGESYITEDVLELAIAMTKNKAMDMIHKEFKKIDVYKRQVLTDQRVICLLVHLILVAVPVCHPAFVRAELLFLPAGVLLDGLSTLLANGGTFRRRMAAQMGLHCIG